MIRDDNFYETLSPGVRRTVRWLHEQDHETTDSGDGSNYAAGMENASPEPMIAIRPISIRYMAFAALDLAEALRMAGVEIHETSVVRVEASYSPNDRIGVLLILGLTDDILFPQIPVDG